MQKAKPRFEQVPVDEVIRLLADKASAAEQSAGFPDDEGSKSVRNPAAAPNNVRKLRAKHAIREGEEHPFGPHR